MKASYLTEHGDIEVLQYGDLPDPRPQAGEVLVQIKAVAMNHLDLWIRKGMPHLKHEYPLILGSDMCGVIVECGEGVSHVHVGQKVLIHPAISCGLCEACSKGWDNLCPKYQILGEHINGGYCEFITVPERNILPYPEKLNFHEAACVPLVFLTAWQMLVVRGKIRPGQLLLIHGAGSGMGSAGIQIAKLFNCTVITTAGSDEKLQKAKELGADYGINYKKENFFEAVTHIAGKQNIDLVFEHIGQAMWNDSIKSLKWGGILVTCGATTGFKVETDLRHIFFRQIQVLGSTMGSRGEQFDILRHIESGKLKPILDKVFSLREAKEAHRYLEASEQFGKVVLEP